MSEFTTLSVTPDVADEVRAIRDDNDHENTSAALRAVLSGETE